LLVVFQKYDIVFVPIISGLSLADEPVFKKVPRGSPLHVAVPRDIRN